MLNTSMACVLGLILAGIDAVELVDEVKQVKKERFVSKLFGLWKEMRLI